jgi:LuxR family maltose regulon positive regulatory protein
MKVLEQHIHALPGGDEAHCPILICLLGNFLLLKAGQPIVLRNGGKTKALLGHLGLEQEHGLPRDTLLQLLWPMGDTALASQSLHSLVYSLHKLVGDALDGAAPVYHDEGGYRLNLAAGVGVDVTRFDALIKAGDQQARTGDLATASQTYRGAVELYRGDLCLDTDVQTRVERERLRTRYLTLLAQLADYHYSAGEYTASLEYAWRLLGRDPCREDARRLVMQCHVRQGQRAEALHQYRVCVATLRLEFDAAPETATTTLFEQIRLDPGSI